MKTFLLIAVLMLVACTPLESFPEDSPLVLTGEAEYYDQMAEDYLNELRSEQIDKARSEYLDSLGRPDPEVSGSGRCDRAYPDPDVCIPSPPPDLDCVNIPYRRFTVLPPDPHGFDMDHDGIGCESG